MPIYSAATPNQITRTRVCVDTAADCEMTGSFYNPYLPCPIPFSSVQELLGNMEEMFDYISFPQPAFRVRGFLRRSLPAPARTSKAPRRYGSDEEMMRRSGAKGTFDIVVQFRLNASWQGSVRWVERDELRPFESVLELMRWMAAAMMEKDSFLRWPR